MATERDLLVDEQRAALQTAWFYLHVMQEAALSIERRGTLLPLDLKFPSAQQIQISIDACTRALVDPQRQI